MEVAPIGIITICLGLICLRLGQKETLYVFLCISLLGAASAIFLGTSGQIQPVHLFLVFLIPHLFLKQSSLTKALTACAFPNPGFWLLSFTVVSVMGAYFNPRIFEGSTYIFAVGISESGQSLMLTPLSPVGGNTTQSIYCIADLLCFVVILSLISSREKITDLSTAFLLYGAVNIFFAISDIATYYSGTESILSIIRNTTYTMHVDEISNGLKRIAGSFTEASTFSTATLGVFGYTSFLWLYGRWSYLSGFTALISMVMLLISTSSTAIVCAPVLLITLYLFALKIGASSASTKNAMYVIFSFPVIVVFIVLLLAINQTLLVGLNEFLSTLIFDKAQSQSGLERSGWNAAALQNFLDTGFLGAGLGSVRASSFVLALLSNVGLPGTILFSFYLLSVFFSGMDNDDGLYDVRLASKVGMLGLLMSSIVSGALVDLGFQFYLFAALACAKSSTKPHGHHSIAL